MKIVLLYGMFAMLLGVSVYTALWVSALCLCGSVVTFKIMMRE